MELKIDNRKLAQTIDKLMQYHDENDDSREREAVAQALGELLQAQIDSVLESPEWFARNRPGMYSPK